MIDVTISIHARDMLKEREIPEEWVLLAINSPDLKEKMSKITIGITQNQYRNEKIAFCALLSTRKLPLIAL